MTAPPDVLVVLETDAGRATALDREMLGLARELAGDSGGTVHACIFGSGPGDAAADAIAHGADHVHVVDSPALAAGGAEALLPDAVALVGRVGPGAVLVGHTPRGAELAPRLAFRLGTAVATGCNRAAIVDGKLHVTRPCYGGKAEEVVSFRTSPAVFSVKPKCFAPLPADADRRAEIVALDSILDPATLSVKVRGSRRDAGDGARLESASVVVAGGGGMKGAAGFEQASRLAELLGGAVGASRVACDLGWCPSSWQVGLSGKTIAPELYIAIGISGAGQHMAGCGNAKTIVAINSDADAPIFRYARYGIVADCHEVMPALIERIEAQRG